MPSPPPRPAAAIYLRISLDATGEGLAVDRQRDDCLRIVSEREWDLYDEYVDHSISASDRKTVRPAYNRLLVDARAGRFEHVVCYDLDRLTRQPRQLEDWIDIAEERHVTLVTATGEADLGTDNGRLFARIKASVARAEIEAKGRRQRVAAQQRAARGRPPLGTRLTGYEPDGTVVDDEAAVVRGVFDRFVRGDSLRGIAAALTKAGVPTRSVRRATTKGSDAATVGSATGQWNPSSIVTILRNPRYAGLAIYQGELTGGRGTWTPLVTEDAWRLAQSRLDDPRRKLNKAGTERKHLGSGLYRCAECLGPAVAWSGNRYRCARCEMSRSGGPVDALVLALVAARLRRPDIVELLTPAADEGAARALAAEGQALRERLARFDAEYDDGLIDGHRHRQATAKAQAELDTVERQRLGQLSTTAASSLLRQPDPGAAFLAETLMIQRQVLDALVEIRLARQPRGSRVFVPESVIPVWRHTEPPTRRPRLVAVP